MARQEYDGSISSIPKWTIEQGSIFLPLRRICLNTDINRRRMSNGNEQNNTRNPVPALKELFVLALGPLFRYSLGMAGHPDKACRSPAGSSIRVPTASSLKLETRLRSTPWPVFRLLMRAILGAILTISIVSFIGCTRPSFRWETHTWSAPSSSNFDAHVLTEEPVAIAPTMTPSIVSGYRSVLSLILQ